MDRRLVLPLLAAAAITFACGPRPHGRGEALATERVDRAHPAAAKAAKPRRSHKGPAVETALTVTTAGELRMALAVANRGDHRVELVFPDGRTYDFAIVDGAGREVWRWSHGRLFTQGTQATMIAPGDSVVYAERWMPPAPGRYTVLAQLRSENHPETRRVTVDVPGPAAAAQVAAH
jgi:hypothetical protein